MKTIQLMLMLSILSAGISHASDDESSLEPLAYAVAPAAASGIRGWLSSFQRPSLPSKPSWLSKPSWFSSQGLGRGLAYTGGLAESAARGLSSRLGFTPERVTGWIGSTPEKSMQYLQSTPGASYLLNNPRIRQQALAAALIGLPAAYYGYSKLRGNTPAPQPTAPVTTEQRELFEQMLDLNGQINILKLNLKQNELIMQQWIDIINEIEIYSALEETPIPTDLPNIEFVRDRLKTSKEIVTVISKQIKSKEAEKEAIAETLKPYQLQHHKLSLSNRPQAHG